MDFVELIKYEGENPNFYNDSYRLKIRLSSGNMIHITAGDPREDKEIEKLILDLHGLGIMGNRYYSAVSQCHITKWEIPN